MIDRVRAWLNRPLRDGSRRALFTAAAAVILAGAVVLALLDHGATAPEPTTSTAKPATRTAPQKPPPASLERPNEEGPSQGRVASREQVDAAKQAAQRFLDDYLEYTYGRRSADRIDAASEELRARLEAQRPRVPASERDRRARVEVLQAHGAGEVRAAMLALVDDGARRYTISLELERRRSGWQVTAVGA